MVSKTVGVVGLILCLVLAGCATPGLQQSFGTKTKEDVMVDVKVSLPVYFSPVFTDENSPPSNKSEVLPVKIPHF